MSEKREILLGAGIDFNVKTGPNITQSTSSLSTHHKVILLLLLHLGFFQRYKETQKHVYQRESCNSFIACFLTNVTIYRIQYYISSWPHNSFISKYSLQLLQHITDLHVYHFLARSDFKWCHMMSRNMNYCHSM